LTGAAALVQYNSVMTTDYEPGFNPASQSYTVVILGKQTYRLRLQPNGTLEAYST